MAKRSTSDQISGQDIFDQVTVDISKTVLTPLELVYKSLVIDTQLVKDGGSGGTVVFSSQNIDNKGTIDLGGGKNGYSTRIIPQQLKGFLLTMASSLIPGRPALLRS